MPLRRRELVGGRVRSGGRIARPLADQTSRLAAAEDTPGWTPGRGSSQFLYTRPRLRPGRDEHVADRFYESRGVLPEPERAGGERRYGEEVLRRLAIIDAAQRVGFTLEEIRDLLGSREELAHERLRRLAVMKLPELDELIARATSVRRVLKICSTCKCESIDVCRMFDERLLPLPDLTGPARGQREARRGRRVRRAGT